MNTHAKILCIWLVSAVILVGTHWAICLPNEISETALRFYALHYAGSGKGVAMFSDILIPGALVGLFIGRIGWKMAPLKLTCYAIVFGIMLGALRLLYVQMIPEDNLYWWEKDQTVKNTVINVITASVIVGVWIYGGRLHREAQSGPRIGTADKKS